MNITIDGPVSPFASRFSGQESRSLPWRRVYRVCSSSGRPEGLRYESSGLWVLCGFFFVVDPPLCWQAWRPALREADQSRPEGLHYYHRV